MLCRRRCVWSRAEWRLEQSQDIQQLNGRITRPGILSIQTEYLTKAMFRTPSPLWMPLAILELLEGFRLPDNYYKASVSRLGLILFRWPKQTATSRKGFLLHTKTLSANKFNPDRKVMLNKLPCPFWGGLQYFSNRRLSIRKNRVDLEFLWWSASFVHYTVLSCLMTSDSKSHQHLEIVFRTTWR